MFALQIDNLQDKSNIQIIVLTFMRRIFNDQLRFKSDRCIARRKRERRAYDDRICFCRAVKNISSEGFPEKALSSGDAECWMCVLAN